MIRSWQDFSSSDSLPSLSSLPALAAQGGNLVSAYQAEAGWSLDSADQAQSSNSVHEVDVCSNRRDMT